MDVVASHTHTHIERERERERQNARESIESPLIGLCLEKHLPLHFK